MAFLLGELLWVALVPSATAALLLVLGRQVGLRSAVTWAASVGGGIIVGQIGLSLRKGSEVAIGVLWQPSSAHDWLPWLVLMTIGITTLAAYAPRSWQRWVYALACVFALAFPVRLFAGGLTQRWSFPEKLLVVALVAVALMALWTTLALGRTNGGPRLRACLLIAVAAGIAVAIALSGSFTYGQLGGIAAASLAGALLADVIAGQVSQSSKSVDGLSGAAGPLSVSLGGLILVGTCYAQLPAIAAVLLAAALAASAGRLPTNWPAQPLGKTFLRVALCLVPLAAAVAISFSANSGNPY